LCDAFGISIAQFFSDVADSTLTDEQNELLKNWARLSKPQQETIRVYMKGLLQEPL
jgi:ElaB/YqjD/DUF883 family membrane-anchored ribosome-binding protein